MDRIKVDNFLGLYTNVDESKLNPEYQSEAVNVRFRTGYIESEGYVASEAVLPADIIYEAPVVLDDDRLHNKLNEFGELVNDYKQNLQEYLMVVSSVGNKSKVDFELLSSIIPEESIPNSPSSPLDLTPFPPDFYLSGDSLPVLLYWERMAPQQVWARWWKIQISTLSANNFESGIIYEKDDVSPLPTNASAASILITEPLQINLNYYWRVCGRANEGEWGEWGEVQSFQINENISALEPPELVSPLNNSTGIISPIKLQWTNIIGNNGYYFQIATDSSFSDIVVERSSPKDWTSYAGIILDPLRQYYWRILTLSFSGNSEWSNTWSFTTAEVIIEPVTYNFTKVYKHWNSKGIVLLITDNGIYWGGKIDRIYRGINPPNILPISILKHINLDFQTSVSIQALDTIDPSLRVPVTFKTTLVKIISDGNTQRLTQYDFDMLFLDGVTRGNYTVQELWTKANGSNPNKYSLAHSSKFLDEIFRTDGQEWSYNISYLDFSNSSAESAIVLSDDDRFITPAIEFVLTYTINEYDEYVIYYKEMQFLSANYFLKVSNLFDSLSQNIADDPRISGISLYVRTNKKDDFEQILFIPLLNGKPQELSNDYYFSQAHLNGFYLSQTIGTVYSPSTYKPIKDFTDYIEIDGIAYAIYNQRVYFPAIGKGQILNGTFYDYIPEVEGDLLSDINGTLGVFGNQLKLVVAQDSREGYLLFSIKDKMNFKIRDQYDLATSPEGIIIHTKRGIYVTNGYERKLISEQINNIVEKNFDTGNIFYHRTEDILFYSYIDDKGNYFTFKFDFVYGNWSEVKDGISGKLTFNEDGIIHFLDEERGKVYKLDKTNNVYSVIRTPNVDLDYPFLGKNLIYIDVDFEGKLNYENYKVTHTKRMTARLGVPVSKRIPNALIGARFIFKGKIYSIDIYYDAIGEFRHENHIPSPETISEGIQQYPEYLKSLTE